MIPVYNGEKYIKKTIDSLLEQTYGDFEVFFVDDGSTDKSINIIYSYAQSDKRINIRKKEHGGRVAKSINYILPELSGYYYFYMSQDDIISAEIFEMMVSRSNETGADIVIPDMCYYYEDAAEKNSFIIGLMGDRNKILRGKEAFVYSLDWDIHGFALFKLDQIRKIGIKDFSFNSDEYAVRVLYLNSEKIAFSGGVFYYRQHEEAITKKISVKLFEYLLTNLEIYELVKINDFQEVVHDKCIMSNATWLIVFTLRFLKNKNTFNVEERKMVVNILKYAFNKIDKKQLCNIKLKDNKIKSYLWLLMFYHNSFNFFVFFCFIYDKVKHVNDV